MMFFEPKTKRELFVNVYLPFNIIIFYERTFFICFPFVLARIGLFSN